MSFILEALKKSEQERRRNQAPDLQTEHTPPPERRKGRRLWPVFIVAALLLNAALLLWLLYPDPPSEPPPVQQAAAPPEAEPVSVPATAREEASAQVPKQSPLPTREVAAVEESLPTVREPSPEPSPIPAAPPTKPPAPAQKKPAPKAESTPPRLETLPQAFRRELPELSISLHFYTDEPTARMVRINGRNLRQNQRINDNLILQEITPDGVVLDFKGQRFAMGSYGNQ